MECAGCNQPVEWTSPCEGGDGMSTITSDMAQRIQRRLEAVTAQGLDSDVRKTLHRAIKGLQRAVEHLGQQEVMIAQDPRLTEEGRKACLATVVLQQVRDLSWLGTLLREAEAAYDRLYRLLFPGPQKAVGDAVLAYLQEQEIRTRCMRLQQRERTLVYRQAVAQGNEEIIRALAGGPGEALVPPSMQEAIAREHVQASNPEAYKRLEDLQLLCRELGIVAEQTRDWLRDLGTEPFPAVDTDPMRAA